MSIFFATIIRIVLGRLNKQLDEEEGTNIDPNRTWTAWASYYPRIPFLALIL
jgi:hypothetical protein